MVFTRNIVFCKTRFRYGQDKKYFTIRIKRCVPTT